MRAIQCSNTCGAGYCDPSVGRCVCPTGWRGAGCAEAFLGACRTSNRSPVMACEGFSGVMSCACKRLCAIELGNHSVKAKPCFELHGPDGVTEPLLSDFPTNESAVRLHVRLRSAAVPLWRAEFMLAKSNPVAFGAGGAQPAPNARCPGACSHRGTCVEARNRIRFCLCHKGFHGRVCEESDSSACINHCSRRGECLARFCRCEQGSFGVDCSLQARDESARQRPPYVPTYIYSLPDELSTLHHLYQNDPTDRGVFYANRVFLQQLLSRQDAGFTCSPHPASGQRPYYAALDHLQARCPRGACVAWEPCGGPRCAPPAAPKLSSRSKGFTTCHCQVKTRSSPRSRRPSSSSSQ